MHSHIGDLTFGKGHLFRVCDLLGRGFLFTFLFAFLFIFLFF